MQRVALRRAINDGLISCAAVALLVLTLVAMDGRVREQVSMRFSTREAVAFTQAGGQMRDLASVVYDVVRDQSSTHGPLLIFVVAATLLVVFMVRT
jgi:hypothetical protein